MLNKWEIFEKMSKEQQDNPEYVPPTGLNDEETTEAMDYMANGGYYDSE